MIVITFPNGRNRVFNDYEFELYGTKLEHKTENIILDINHPHRSYLYETDLRCEICNKESISYQIYDKARCN